MHGGGDEGGIKSQWKLRGGDKGTQYVLLRQRRGWGDPMDKARTSSVSHMSQAKEANIRRDPHDSRQHEQGLAKLKKGKSRE